MANPFDFGVSAAIEHEKRRAARMGEAREVMAKAYPDAPWAQDDLARAHASLLASESSRPVAIMGFQREAGTGLIHLGEAA